ncbi:glycine oxidase ThiO [Actinopolyspora erythraea]|uniref:glycine oxidase n=1 Tax=Actinopolyspora erythraea TaxID=414996 RepID=A0A099D4B6_9ACTN|nr:glycine oxidase ThiO [Actinopolyspora erythraea]ASU77334.1 glycine oxidase ThiO [Actinopolyspora erythraea]KGI80175.1 glycine oxidase [Actinopolyspora erythraea]
MTNGQHHDVALVGGGVIGLSCAWRLAALGCRVRLVDPEPGGGASHVAGGMLAPLAEAWFGEEELLELGSASLRRWPEFAAELARAADAPSGLNERGTLVVGADSADREQLHEVAEHLAALGWEVNRHSGRALRKLEPSLAPNVHGGLEVPGDLSVDNRAALEALRRAALRSGVEFRAESARRVGPGCVELADGSELRCDVAVIAAGSRSGELHDGLAGAVRPVKGEILRLRRRATALPPPERTVRGPVHGRQVYLVPRPPDGLVVGATQYEAGFDTRVTVGGVRDLIGDAERLVAGLGEYELTEATAGLRPGTPDNLPLIGWLEPGVLVATGHHRNGFLHAPITAEAVAALLRDGHVPAETEPADPARSGGQL